MPPSILNNSEQELPLGELVATYLQAMTAGESPDREQLLAEHPDLANELQPFFDDHDWFLRLSGAASPSDGSRDHVHSEDSHGGGVIGDTQIHEPDAGNCPEFSPRTFGDYDLLEEIGRGGMGVIYKARQRSLSRIVALKMIRSSRLASREEIDRFYSEAETAAALDHPNIVPIFEVGQHLGQHFYSMAYVEGLSLGQLLQEEGLLDPQTAAELVRRLADSLAYAHDRGVIHRDLKPENILLAPSPSGEGVLLAIEAATGHYDPKVTDFGLAKRMESDSGLTGTGQILGTPSYMAPEQAAGNIDEISPLSDVYSLGAVLYCLLTGRPPFRASSVVDTLHQVIRDEPAPLRQLNTAVPRDLETICLKCLQKNPGRRYASDRELAGDLRRFREGEPITARPTSQLERSWKWARRRPTAATLVFVTFFAVMFLVALTVSYAYHFERERLLYSRGILLAHQSWRDREITRAQQLLQACPLHMRGWEWDYVERLCRTRLESTFKPDPTSGQSLAFALAYSHEGRLIAIGDELGPVRVWDARNGEEVVTLDGHTAQVSSVEFSPDDRFLASASEDGCVKLWEWETAREVNTFSGHQGFVHGAAFSPNGRRLVSCGQDGTLRLWNCDDASQLAVASQHSGDVNGLAFSFDGRLIASAGDDGTVRLWNGDDLTESSVLRGHTASVNAVAFSHDNLHVASASDDNTVKLWDLKQRRLIVTAEGSRLAVNDVKFSPDDSRLVSCGWDRSVRIWDALTGRLMQKLVAHTRGVDEVAFHPDGRHVASAGWDLTVNVWDIGSGEEATILKGHTGPVSSVVFTSDGDLLASAGDDGIIMLWRPDNREVVRSFKAHDDQISALTFSPDGRLLASASYDRTIIVWDASTGRLIRTLKGHSGRVYGVSFSPDGDLLASASHDGTLIIWDSGTGEKQRVFARDKGPVTSPTFSPNGNRIAVGGWDGAVAVWKLDGSPEPVLFQGHSREVLSVCFSPDGTRLVSGDRSGAVLVWHASRGFRMAELVSHLDSVTGVAFSPQGDRVASTSRDGSVKIWEFKSQQETLSLNGQSGRAYCVVFRPDGRYIATANHDGTITLWGR